VFQGTPRQIVQQMQDIAMGAPSMTLSEYVDWVAARAADGRSSARRTHLEAHDAFITLEGTSIE
jgi:hypothetical protein